MEKKFELTEELVKKFHDYGYEKFDNIKQENQSIVSYFVRDFNNTKRIEDLPHPDDFDISDELSELFRMEPFLAQISLYVKKIKTYDIPTAAVGLNLNTEEYEWYWNPLFLCQFPRSIRKAIAIHEMVHIFSNHLTTRKDPNIKHQIINVAQDLAINSMPKLEYYIPNKCLTIDGEVDLVKPGNGNLSFITEKGQTYEYYLKELLKHPEQLEKLGGMGHDQHYYVEVEEFGDDVDVEDLTKEQNAVQNVKKKIADRVNKFVEKISNDYDGDPLDSEVHWGSVSKSARGAIMRSVKIKKSSPEEILRAFVGTVGKGERIKRWTRRNRRNPMKRPGVKNKPNCQIVIAIDQSGSVGEELLNKLFTFAESFKDYIDFYLVPFDSHIDKSNIIFWEKDKKIKTERKLCGGTDFNAPTLYANSKPDIDGLIICTDLGAPKPIKCNVPRLWVTNSQNKRFYGDVCGQEPCILID